MKKSITIVFILPALLFLFLASVCFGDNRATVSLQSPNHEVEQMRIKLPEPRYDCDVSLEQSLVKRRSVRNFADDPITLENVSQLLWAAQGITEGRGGRTAPSAGALYPLEVYVVVGNVRNLAEGVYRYDPKNHEVVMISKEDIRSQLAGAALGQSSVRNGAIDLVFAAVYQRTTRKYGNRGIAYVHMEVGHAAQNVCLQATVIGLGAVTIGAFHDEKVSSILNLSKDEKALYIIPVGKY
jgi:SagB-type dehydrogenase family enzyme